MCRLPHLFLAWAASAESSARGPVCAPTKGPGLGIEPCAGEENVEFGPGRAGPARDGFQLPWA